MVKKEKRFFEIYIFFLIFFFLVRVTNILLDKELNPKLGGDLNERRRFFYFLEITFFFCLDFGIAVLEGVSLSSNFSRLQYVAKGIYGGKERTSMSPNIVDIRFFGIVLLKCKDILFLEI